MSDQIIQYTEEMVGAGHPTKGDTLNRALLVDHNADGTHEKLTLGSDADGDIYYRASGALARLAKGAANLKLFMNAGATVPEWAAGMKITSTTRDMTAATGNVNITGVGFKPSAVFAIAAGAGSYLDGSVGMSDGTTNGCIFQPAAGTWSYAAVAVNLLQGAGNQQYATITLGSDGGTLAWVKVGTPVAETATIYLLWLR